jgi:hypothetical protein
MLHVGMLIGYGLLALLIVIYASAVLVETLNVVAGAAMARAFRSDQRRPDATMD